MTTLSFILLAIIVIWFFSMWCLFFKKEGLAKFFAGFGIFALALLLTFLWITLERPPLKTLGETRLWYALFLSILGVFITFRLKQKWVFYYSLLMAILFLIIDVIKPETMDKTLAPALQSVWFVPHVIVYILSYALLGVAALFALRGLVNIFYKKESPLAQTNLLRGLDQLVNSGLALLSMGLIFGAFWAKEAWGHYWTWDPKESWALLTWIFYLFYIHFRFWYHQKTNAAFFYLLFAFITLCLCWFGLSYLPLGQNSVHVYS